VRTSTRTREAVVIEKVECDCGKEHIVTLAARMTCSCGAKWERRPYDPEGLRAALRSVVAYLGREYHQKEYPWDIREHARMLVLVDRGELAPVDASRMVYVIFDGPPSPEGAIFVEVEDADGHSVCAGEWAERPDGFWSLGPFLLSRGQ
jgi:hypothetical protein